MQATAPDPGCTRRGKLIQLYAALPTFFPPAGNASSQGKGKDGPADWMDDSASTLSVVSHRESLLSDGYAPSSASSFSHLSEAFSTAHFIVDLLAEDQNLGLLIRNNIVEDPRGLARLSRDLRDMLESYGKDLRGHSGDAVGTAAGDFVLTSPRQLLNLLRQRFYPSPRGLGIPERGLEEFKERKVDLVKAYLKNSRSAAEIKESRLAAKEV